MSGQTSSAAVLQRPKQQPSVMLSLQTWLQLVHLGSSWQELVAELPAALHWNIGTVGMSGGKFNFVFLSSLQK